MTVAVENKSARLGRDVAVRALGDRIDSLRVTLDARERRTADRETLARRLLLGVSAASADERDDLMWRAIVGCEHRIAERGQQLIIVEPDARFLFEKLLHLPHLRERLRPHGEAQRAQAQIRSRWI